MDAAECPQECAEGCAGSFTAVAMHLALAVAIVIARPLVLTVIDSRVGGRHPVIAAALVRVDLAGFYYYSEAQNEHSLARYDRVSRLVWHDGDGSAGERLQRVGDCLLRCQSLAFGPRREGRVVELAVQAATFSTSATI